VVICTRSRRLCAAQKTRLVISDGKSTTGSYSRLNASFITGAIRQSCVLAVARRQAVVVPGFGDSFD